MRIAILHNAVAEDAPPEDLDTLVQAEVVADALMRLGHRPERVPCTLDLAAMRDDLWRCRPEVVFNLVESLGDCDSLAYLPLAVLDTLDIPYTGSRTESLFLTTHKILAKQRMRQAGLPTADWMEGGESIHEGKEGGFFIHEGHEGHEEEEKEGREGKEGGFFIHEGKEGGFFIHEGHEGHEGKEGKEGREGGVGGVFVDDEGGVSGRIEGSNIDQPDENSPAAACRSSNFLSSCSSWMTSRSSWIIKGIWDQGSRDMDDDAVVRDVEPAVVQDRLKARFERTGRPCFAERFIDGREFVVTVLADRDGPVAQPPAEIEFTDYPPDKPRIVGYRAKWCDDCSEYHRTPRRFEFEEADRPLLERLKTLAEECWRVFRLRGWARVDFRVDAAGEPWILEVNANPCLSPDAGFAAALQWASIPFDEAIRRILDDCK